MCFPGEQTLVVVQIMTVLSQKQRRTSREVVIAAKYPGDFLVFSHTLVPIHLCFSTFGIGTGNASLNLSSQA